MPPFVAAALGARGVVLTGVVELKHLTAVVLTVTGHIHGRCGYMRCLAAMKVFMSEFEAMYAHRGLWVAVWHPFVSGRLARCQRVAEMIEDMQTRGGVWFATMEEIATHVQACIDDGSWTPRVDELPYYEGTIPELSAWQAKAAE